MLKLQNELLILWTILTLESGGETLCGGEVYRIVAMTGEEWNVGTFQ